MTPLLAFAKAKRYPKIEPGLDLEIGWWVFLAVLAVVFWAWTRAPWWRRALFEREDPRIYALFRVMLAAFTLGCFWNLEPYWRFLWSDEGMFTLVEAQQRLGRSALSGWTPESGFLDTWAVFKFFAYKPSLWFLHGSPAYVYTSMWVFFGLLVAYAVGFRTRVTGVLCWLMVNSIYDRNSFYLEGTDTVFRVLWFYALFARTDAAWSVDNAIRVSRLRRREAKLARGGPFPADLGLLADRLLSIAWAAAWAWLIAVQLDMHFDAPLPLLGLAVSFALAEAAWVARQTRRAGPQPVLRYPGVARWPRILIMVQYAFLYCDTGAVKTGVVWMRGDALYYALNLDHFYRFEGLTQWVSAYLGTNLFRLMTYVTHFWEIGFPIVLVGVWLAHRWAHEDAAWAREARASWRHRAGSIALLVFWAALGIGMTKSFPYLFPLNDAGNPTMPAFAVPAFAWSWGLGLPLLLGLSWGLARRAPTVPSIKIRRLRTPSFTIDREFLRAWLLGRRLWLGLGLCFHGFLILFMNIGLFPLIMLGGYLSFTSARAWLVLARRVLARAPGRLATWAEGPAFAPWAGVTPTDATEELRGDPRGQLDDHWVLVVGGATLGLVAARAQPPTFAADWDPSLAWAGFALAALGLALRHRPFGRSLAGLGAFAGLITYGVLHHEGMVEMSASAYSGAIGRGMQVVAVAALVVAAWTGVRARWSSPAASRQPSLVGGPSSRLLVVAFMLWHIGAVSAVLFPSMPIWGTWHSPARRVFGSYLRATKTTQSWRMFAPNPPRANSFSRTVLVDAEGRHWDLNNNAYYDRASIFLVNDRMRKMQRRLIGKGKWYLRYWANFHCREWELSHGEAPKEIQVYKINTRIPSPSKSWRRPWNPRKTKVTLTFVQTHGCGDKGAVTPEMKLRRGIPLDDEDRRRMEEDAERAARESKTRRESWARRRDFGGDGPPMKMSFVPQGDTRAAPRSGAKSPSGAGAKSPSGAGAKSPSGAGAKSP